MLARGAPARYPHVDCTRAGAVKLPIPHSYGGAVITNAATGDPNVKGLVYVDAFAPAWGQTVGELVTAHPGSCVLPEANVTVQPYPGAPEGAGGERARGSRPIAAARQ
jgi:pimeloyl-ACP methyl ester carboxylesterase